MSNNVVDQAFQRLFGYPWGSAAEKTSPSSLPQELVDVFGSKVRVERILRLPSIAGHAAAAVPKEKDAAMLLTKRIVVMNKNGKRKAAAAITISNTANNNASFKRRRIVDFKNIELPKDVLAAKSAMEIDTATTTTTKTTAAAKKAPSIAAKAPSKLDSVLQKIAGEKKQNTVEKTSDDWETFKGEDKQLQDELELQATSKNAYLVKQDFLNRVDQRRFEIEKEGRDQERGRRQLAQAGSKK